MRSLHTRPIRQTLVRIGIIDRPLGPDYHNRPKSGYSTADPVGHKAFKVVFRIIGFFPGLSFCSDVVMDGTLLDLI